MAYLDSPCKGICHSRKFDDVLMCCGCLRYPDEVEGWFEMSDEERQRVLKELPFPLVGCPLRPAPVPL